MKTKNPIKVKTGKKNRASGADFERRVRFDLENKGWIVSKWMQNVETGNDKTGWLVRDLWKCIPAKHKFRGPGIPFAMGTGMPDFIAYREPDIPDYVSPYKEIIFVECKSNGILSKEEKEKAKWYLDNNFCSKFLIAYKTKIKNKIKVNYKEFVE